MPRNRFLALGCYLFAGLSGVCIFMCFYKCFCLHRAILLESVLHVIPFRKSGEKSCKITVFTTNTKYICLCEKKANFPTGSAHFQHRFQTPRYFYCPHCMFTLCSYIFFIFLKCWLDYYTFFCMIFAFKNIDNR